MPSIILRNIRKRVRHKFMTHPLSVGINMLYDSCSISVINISHSHRFDLLIKGRIQFLFRNTTKCLIMLVHTDVVRLIEATEHAYLRELGNTREQNKLQVIIASLNTEYTPLSRLRL